MLSDYKITQEESSANGVVSAPDVLTGTAQENKAVFDKLTNQVVITKHNGLIDELSQSGASDTGIDDIEGLVATTVQDALEEINQNYEDIIDPANQDTAGKLGFTPFPNVAATNVQDAVEEVQRNLETAVDEIQADVPTASEVPSNPFPGVTSDNVQGALEELNGKVEDIQAGVIPSGSITGDMIQDGAVTADKLGSDVTGEEIPTSASDPTSISSQLSNRVSGSYKIYNSIAQLGIVPESTTMQDIIDAVGVHAELHALINSGVADICPSRTGSLHIVRTNVNRANVIFFDNLGNIWRAETNMSEFIDWIKISDATPPQEFDLPLADGWSGWAKYSKDQFGRVLVYGLVAKSTALISGDVIGTFPEGFRPSDTCPMTITSGNASDGKSFATSGYVQPSGALTLSNGTISSVYKLGNNLAFNFVFPAAD